MGKTIVTLVHGTFAAGAPWTQEGSALRAALTRALGDDVECRPFKWSGRNSFAARADAASALRTALEKQIADEPNAKHAIIAHSHGGNVALYALRSAELAKAMDTVVCLSTPFITTYRRHFGESGGIVTELAAVYVALSTGLVCASASLYGMGATNDGYWGPIFLAVAAISGGLTWWALRRLARAWVRRADAWAREVTVETNLGDRLLIIHPAADEASESLSSVHFATVPVVRGWMLLAALALKPITVAATIDAWASPRWYGRLLVASALYACAMGWLLYQYPQAPPERMFQLGLLMGVSTLGGAIFSRDVELMKLIAFATVPVILVLGAAFVVLLLLLTLAIMPFNSSVRDIPSFATTAMWLGPIGVTATHFPAGAVGAPRLLPGDATDGLRHSRPYDDELAIGWIVERLKARLQMP